MFVLTLASASSIRAHLLRAAGLTIDIQPARIDEESLRDSLLLEGASPRDIADALAESKALKVANKHPQAMVLGCDQLLELDGALFEKPQTQQDARHHLTRLSGKTHRLFTAAVLYKDGEPIWRYCAVPRLSMRTLSASFIDSYVDQNWDSIQHCVGCYQIEGIGLRLFDRIEGDLFAIQGLPMLELLTTLTRRGDIPG